MKPYYSHAGITIYHGDCREILPQLDPVDLVLTDPPYGVNYLSGGRIEKFDRIRGDGTIQTWWLRDIKTEVIVVFTRWDVCGVWATAIADVHPVRGCLVWHKACGGMGDLQRSFAPDYEMVIYASSDTWMLPGKRVGSVWQCNIEPPFSYLHPTQKPIVLIRTCLVRFGGGTILDPFLGSGTTLRAAKDLGRKAIGIEIEERYCEIAAKRMGQEVFDFAGKEAGL